jgi:hypothetical protein
MTAKGCSDDLLQVRIVGLMESCSISSGNLLMKSLKNTLPGTAFNSSNDKGNYFHD